MKQVLLMCCAAAGCLSAVLCFTAADRHALAAQPTNRKPDIVTLIAQLGSERFEVREAATRQLMELEDAPAALREALKSGDAEVARRAAAIVDSFARRERRRAFAALARAAKRGAIDQAVERLARRQRWDDEAACWRLMAGLADKLTALEQENYKTASLRVRHPVSEAELLICLGGLQLQTIGARGDSPAVWERRIVLRAEEVLKVRPVEYSLFAVSGGAQMMRMSFAALFAGGSVEAHSPITNSLIVCDGDFTAQSIIANTLVIARGTIRCDDVVSDSRLISCGKVEFARPQYVHETKVVENERKPLGFVTFFDPADVGIKVESADGGVRVKEAEKGKPFAAAGLRADDLVTALDSETVKDTEAFRRLLRAKLAVAGTTTFKVRRGDKAVEIAVAHKD